MWIFIYLQIICLHHLSRPVFTQKKLPWFLGDCLLFILQLQAYLLSWNSLHFMKVQPKSMTCVNQFHFLHTKFWSDLTLVWDILPFPLGFFLYIKRTQTKNTNKQQKNPEKTTNKQTKPHQIKSNQQKALTKIPKQNNHSGKLSV